MVLAAPEAAGGADEQAPLRVEIQRVDLRGNLEQRGLAARAELIEREAREARLDVIPVNALALVRVDGWFGEVVEARYAES